MNIRLTADGVWSMLEAQRVGVFTSLRRDDVPISLPVWYAPIDRRIYLHGPRRAKKFSRVRHNPHVAFLCETGEKSSELRAVHLTGVARVIEDEDVQARVTAAFDLRYADLRPPTADLPKTAGCLPRLRGDRDRTGRPHPLLGQCPLRGRRAVRPPAAGGAVARGRRHM